MPAVFIIILDISYGLVRIIIRSDEAFHLIFVFIIHSSKSRCDSTVIHQELIEGEQKMAKIIPLRDLCRPKKLLLHHCF